MFMSDNKKKASMVIADMGAPMNPKPDVPDSMEYDASAGYDAAAQEMIDAMHSKSPKALRSALKSFVSMCMDEPDADDDSTEDSED